MTRVVSRGMVGTFCGLIIVHFCAFEPTSPPVSNLVITPDCAQGERTDWHFEAGAHCAGNARGFSEILIAADGDVTTCGFKTRPSHRLESSVGERAAQGDDRSEDGCCQLFHDDLFLEPWISPGLAQCPTDRRIAGSGSRSVRVDLEAVKKGKEIWCRRSWLEHQHVLEPHNRVRITRNATP